MARKQSKRFWLCRHGHPMWRKRSSGHWICHTCNDMNLNHKADELGVCIYGHKRIVGKNCYTCNIYSQTQWLRELDENGVGTCPSGHPVSHHDDSIIYHHTRKFRSRRCKICTEISLTKARANPYDFKNAPMCRNGLHPKDDEHQRIISGVRSCYPCWKAANARSVMRAQVKKQKKRALPAAYVDWVVVERMLARGTMEYIRRGATTGPTDGERWVAYCTFVKNHGAHPEDLYGEPGHDAMTLFKYSAWRGLGKKHQWREFTLYDLMTIIPTEQYMNGGFLRKYPKKGKPPA
jgi:hypothetical protein